MVYRLLADGVMLVHFGFILFIALGGLLAWRWPGIAYAHLPSVVYGLVSVTVGFPCPLTPLEKHFRLMADEGAYTGGFVDRYIEGVIYPDAYTPLLRGIVAVLVVAGYAALLRRRNRLSVPETREVTASPAARPASYSG